ncbi:MAG TPA: bifunctional 4-hydroxy-2-oxoglutarate aldolase/2-dehydro-3-deoxy-phosphogluconate aldolase [Bryobacteraceae bacterium]|jgi:2-dehydro-3-deoxyphosphogluconate aldolase/(4S)-4-hydroxy-2-oxoglutarate aldolase
MIPQDVRSRIVEEKIIPVVRAASPELAMRAAEAICAGGISVVEITMTVPGAIEIIRELRRSARMLVGAGTVVDAAIAQKCAEAGAQFLVTPGLDVPTLNFAKRAGLLIMPGTLTTGEILTAWKNGAVAAKIFPCGNLGGPSYIAKLKSALPSIDMIPTGGVNLSNAAEFIRAGAIAVGVGGELVSSRALAGGDLAAIANAARQFKTALANAAD